MTADLPDRVASTVRVSSLNFFEDFDYFRSALTGFPGAGRPVEELLIFSPSPSFTDLLDLGNY
jgi:hypothetical protein